MDISPYPQNSKTWCEEQRPSLLKQKACILLAKCSFFKSWRWWDYLCSSSYPRRSGIQFVYAVEISFGSCRLVLCAPEYFVFLSYREVSNLWPVTSYPGIVTVAPPALVLLGGSLSPERMAQLMKQLLYCGRFQPGAIKKKKKIGSSLS